MFVYLPRVPVPEVDCMSAFRNSTRDVDVGRLFASLAANWHRILIVSVAVAGLALIFARLATPLYKGETRLLIETGLPASIRSEVQAGNDRPALDEKSVAAQMDVIGSTDLLKQVAPRLAASGRPEFNATGEIPILERLLVTAGLLADPAGISPDERVLKVMRQRLSVYRVGKSGEIAIEFSSEDQRLAAEIPNTLADATIAVQRVAEQQSNADRPAEVRILSRAAPPTESYFPKTFAIVVGAFTASLVIMAIITLLRELSSARAECRATRARPEPIVEVAMPVRVAAHDVDDARGRAPRCDLGRQPREPILLAGRGEVNIEMAAERLITCGAARALFISPQGDEAAATAVLVAREMAYSGLRVLLLDLTSTGAASRPMLESRFHLGITNLLASEAQFSQVIHGDRYSDCHVIPRGTVDSERAMRAVDRLPIIMNSLTTAYDVVVVECGPAGAEGIRRLISDGTEIFVSVLEGEDAAIAEATANLYAAGYGKFALVSPAGYEPPASPAPNRSAA
jgi:Mrp family chromosome partitioning ATPase/capsular polysaccharide biosynthesis protein